MTLEEDPVQRTSNSSTHRVRYEKSEVGSILVITWYTRFFCADHSATRCIVA